MTDGFHCNPLRLGPVLRWVHKKKPLTFRISENQGFRCSISGLVIKVEVKLANEAVIDVLGERPWYQVLTAMCDWSFRLKNIYVTFSVPMICLYQPVSEKVNLEEIPKTQS